MWDVDGNKYFDFLSGESNELVADKSFCNIHACTCKSYNLQILHTHFQPILL